MKYLFVANQKPLQGYTEFCNNTYLALLCETKRNEYSSLPNEYIRSEQLCFIGSTVKLDNSDFNILVIWDRNNLASFSTVNGMPNKVLTALSIRYPDRTFDCELLSRNGEVKYTLEDGKR